MAASSSLPRKKPPVPLYEPIFNDVLADVFLVPPINVDVGCPLKYCLIVFVDSLYAKAI